jgi:alpha-glucosidase
MYYGDELGTGRVNIPAEAMRDPWAKNEPGLGLSRDPSRTPFAWDDSPNAAFTSGTPWLPLAPDYKSQNVETLRKDATSILNLYRRLLKLRRRHSALNIGCFRMLGVQGDMLAYERASKGERVIVCLNFGERDQSLSLAGDLTGATVLISTHLDRTKALSHLILRPNEGVALLMAS